MRRLVCSLATLFLLTSFALAMPPQGGGGAHDGYGQPLDSPDLPLGMLTVKVVAGGNIASSNVGAKVELFALEGGAAKLHATVTTGADGRARFSGLAPGKSYRAQIKGVKAASARSQVVSMPQQGGLRLLLSTPSAATSRPAQPAKAAPKGHGGDKLSKTKDASVLSLLPGTHVIGQVAEGKVQFMQVFVLRNGSRQVFDPGAGLAFPIPAGAAHAALGQGSQGKLRLAEDGKSFLLVSPLPPGQVTMRVTYQITLESSRIDFHQILPIRQETTLFAITNNAMAGLQGPAVLRKEFREQSGGNKLPVYVLRPVAAKGALEFTITDLPFRDPTLRNAVIGISIFLALWGIFGVASGGRRSRALQAQRDRLLDELAALMARHEADDLAEGRFEQERAKLLAKLRGTWDE